jgi:cation diffusion facilitator CzcD-associated flavoprotein CzcO
VKAFEAGSQLGGVWYWNCYPGARVDTEGPIYQFSRDDLWKEWEYTELYPAWSELREYFAYVDRKLEISKHVRLNTRVESADFDSDRNQWVVRASDGTTVRCAYLVPCLGLGSKPYIPPIPGLDTFAGACHHTARWPQDGVGLTGRRIAAIGTGASGVQVIQEAARDAASVTVFQRIPNLAIPMGQRKLTPADQEAIKAELPDRFALRANTFTGFDFNLEPRNAVDLTPDERTAGYEKLWRAGGFRFWLAVFQDTLFDQRANDYAYEFWRNKVRARINDPALAEKLAPTAPPHPFGVQRPSLEQNYYDVYNQDNVSLVDLTETPIRSVTERGILTADGTEREFDVIVLATGFDSVTGGLTAIDIHGSDGSPLRDKWASGARTHLGIATAGFPNMLFIYGPQSPSRFCNGPTCAEIQGEMIVETVDHLLRNGRPRIEATPEAEQEWTNHVAELLAPTLFGKAKSWYMGANMPGKPIQMLNYPGGLPLYRDSGSRHHPAARERSVVTS